MQRGLTIGALMSIADSLPIQSSDSQRSVFTGFAEDDAALSRSIAEVLKLSDLPEVAARIPIRLGYQLFLYALQPEWTQGGVPPFVMTNYPSEWIERYRTRDYTRFDPILGHALRSSQPLLWRHLKNLDPAATSHRQEAVSFGLVDGMTVCANGRNGRHSLLSVCGASFRNLPSSVELGILQRAQWFALLIHEKALQLTRAESRNLAPEPRLTERERACLRASAGLLPLKSIATAVGISERAAKFHLTNAARKLGAHTRQAAAAKAISIGLIDFMVSPPPSIGRWDVHPHCESDPPRTPAVPVRTDS